MDEENDSRSRIIALAVSFPTIEHLPIVRNWDAVALDKWATGGRSHGEKLAAQFVLRVWNQHEDWECGRFDVIEAYGVWDQDHWQAFQKWTKNPFIL